MTSEVWQRVGPLSPRGTPSYPSNGLPGSADVHKHAQTIRSLSRWFLSLAEERKVKLACIRMMAGVPEDCLFFCVLSPVQGPAQEASDRVWSLPTYTATQKLTKMTTFLFHLRLGAVFLPPLSFSFHQFCCILIRYTQSSLHQEFRPSSSGLNCSFSRFVFEVSAHSPPGSPNPEAHLTFSLDSSTPPNCYWTYGLLARASSCSAAAHRFDICMIKPVTSSESTPNKGTLAWAETGEGRRESSILSFQPLTGSHGRFSGFGVEFWFSFLRKIKLQCSKTSKRDERNQKIQTSGNIKDTWDEAEQPGRHLASLFLWQFLQNTWQI